MYSCIELVSFTTRHSVLATSDTHHSANTQLSDVQPEGLILLLRLLLLLLLLLLFLFETTSLLQDASNKCVLFIFDSLLHAAFIFA